MNTVDKIYELAPCSCTCPEELCPVCTIAGEIEEKDKQLDKYEKAIAFIEGMAKAANAVDE